MTAPSQVTAALRDQLANGSLAGTWALDPARSTATLRSKSVWGLVTVKGVFRDVQGSGTVSPAGEVTGSIVIASGSVDTRNAKRDQHLRSADFFLSEKYPSITFSLEKLAITGGGMTVSGQLAVRDQARPISFPATVTLAGDGEVALDAAVEVDRSEFGLRWNRLGMVSMHNMITLHAVFARQ